MRYLILVLFCAFNLNASAQWWRGDFKKHPRLPLITKAKDNSLKKLAKARTAIISRPVSFHFPRTAYNLEICEKLVMKSAQHHMRFREYSMASYDFSELAGLYVQENRLSEAKWYYLQSIYISKNLHNYQHTIKNLVSLAMVKADLGDIEQAKQDLAEARTLAVSAGRTDDVKTVDKKIKYVQSNTVWLPKSELRYAEVVDLSGKTK